MSIEDQLLALKRKVDRLSQLRDKAVWEREAAEKELKTECGTADLKKARKEAERLEKEAEVLEKQIADKLAGVMKEHKELLEMV